MVGTQTPDFYVTWKENAKKENFKVVKKKKSFV